MKYVGIAIVLILLVGGFFLLQPKQTQQSQTTTEKTESTAPTTAAEQPTQTTAEGEAMEKSDGETNNVKEFTVTGSNFSFDPKEITVKKGDTVRITFKNADGMHDFKIDEFNVATKVLQGGTEETVEFTADKVGAFEYYCSVGKHRQMGMKGTLTVK